MIHLLWIIPVLLLITEGIYQEWYFKKNGHYPLDPPVSEDYGEPWPKDYPS